MYYRDELFDRCINQIQNAGRERIAKILKEMGQKILTDSHLDNRACQETIENIRTLAWEASLPSAERNLTIVKAALTYIPSSLGTSLKALKYFQTNSKILRTYFGISA